MNDIIKVIKDKIDEGYEANELVVVYGLFNIYSYQHDKISKEGYYLTKYNGQESIPISDILATKEEVDRQDLIRELNKLDVYYLLDY